MIIKKVKVTDVEYDASEEEIESLPKELLFDIQYQDYDILQDLVEDEISYQTGFCHFGCNFEEIEE